jgi:hypothetical protein
MTHCCRRSANYGPGNYHQDHDGFGVTRMDDRLGIRLHQRGDRGRAAP